MLTLSPVQEVSLLRPVLLHVLYAQPVSSAPPLWLKKTVHRVSRILWLAKPSVHLLLLTWHQLVSL